jgi:tetratricopeptide (TPR) repeat protein
LIFAACAVPGEKSKEPTDVAGLIHHRRYREAVAKAEADARKRPDDAEAQELYRQASLAWLLEQTRRACFEHRNEEALALIEQAYEVGPELPAVRQWRAKIRSELANYWMDVAGAFLLQDNLEAARDAFEKVLEHEPGQARASELLGNVLVRLNYRQGMSESYYDEGIKLLNDYWLHEARSRFSYSGKYLPGSERAEKRSSQVQELLADQRSALALELEREGQYFAANNEFRLALLLEPELEEALAGYERTSKEAEAYEMLKNAEMLVLRKRFDVAQALLEKGLVLTEYQREAFEGALDGVEEGRYDEEYSRALTLEGDGQFEEAVAAYDALLEKASYFRDAIARRDTLVNFMEKAAELYEREPISRSGTQSRVCYWRRIGSV